MKSFYHKTIFKIVEDPHHRGRSSGPADAINRHWASLKMTRAALRTKMGSVQVALLLDLHEAKALGGWTWCATTRGGAAARLDRQWLEFDDWAVYAGAGVIFISDAPVFREQTAVGDVTVEPADVAARRLDARDGAEKRLAL